MIFHDPTKRLIFSKHQNKAEFKNLDDTEVLSSDFPDLRTSAASVNSTASDRKGANLYQWKIGFLMIHSTKIPHEMRL